jgi:hypothetical protein
MMTPDFKRSVSNPAPAAHLSPALTALWWAGKGEWSRAHAIVQDAGGVDAAWVHAYLHRVEGDVGNAGYWYRRAGQPVAAGALDVEWDGIVVALLRDQPI